MSGYSRVKVRPLRDPTQNGGTENSTVVRVGTGARGGHRAALGLTRGEGPANLYSVDFSDIIRVYINEYIILSLLAPPM